MSCGSDGAIRGCSGAVGSLSISFSMFRGSNISTSSTLLYLVQRLLPLHRHRHISREYLSLRAVRDTPPSFMSRVEMNKSKHTILITFSVKKYSKVLVLS